jgi:hypothetical protein
MSAIWSRGRRVITSDPDPATGDDAERPPASDVSRRVFLKRGSLTVAAAGLVTAIPGLPALFSEAAPEAPAAEGAAADASGIEAGALQESLVVQVKNLQTGEMSVYVGEREIVYRDPQLASQILRASR